MKKISLVLLCFLVFILANAQESAKEKEFEKYTPEEIKAWIDAGNDPNKILGEGADASYCVFWAFTNHLGLFGKENYHEAILYMLKESKYPIKDVLYFMDDPGSNLGPIILQYFRVALQNKHQYEKGVLKNLSYPFPAAGKGSQDFNINSMDKYGNVFIVFAAEFRLMPMMEEALKEKALLDTQDGNGMTALHFAVKNKHKAMINTLLNAEADVNLENNKGDTPVIIAAQKKDWDTVRLLVQKGADVKKANKKGKKASDFATTKEHKKALKGK